MMVGDDREPTSVDPPKTTLYYLKLACAVIYRYTVLAHLMEHQYGFTVYIENSQVSFHWLYYNEGTYFLTYLLKELSPCWEAANRAATQETIAKVHGYKKPFVSHISRKYHEKCQSQISLFL
jgi:hypothetical protein